MPRAVNSFHRWVSPPLFSLSLPRQRCSCILVYLSRCSCILVTLLSMLLHTCVLVTLLLLHSCVTQLHTVAHSCTGENTCKTLQLCLQCLNIQVRCMCMYSIAFFPHRHTSFPCQSSQSASHSPSIVHSVAQWHLHQTISHSCIHCLLSCHYQWGLEPKKVNRIMSQCSHCSHPNFKNTFFSTVMSFGLQYPTLSINGILNCPEF